jgi:hypothetical protein
MADTSECGWFVIPPGTVGEIESAIEHISDPQSDIATAQFACGSQAAEYRSEGFQEFPTKQDAENGVAQANNNANPVQTASVSGPDFDKWFVRIGESLAGLLLLYVGLKAMFPSQVQAAMPKFKNVSKKIPPIEPV